MRKPKYTFLLPAYKKRFLEESLLSIKNQSFQDYLCIVSDDCSPEDIKSVYDKVCGNDSRFSYRKNENNFGADNLTKHWNLLVALCNTDYFLMPGDDDIYHPGFLAEIDKLSLKYPDAGVIRSRSQYINSEGEILKQDGLFEEYQDTLSFLFTRYNSSYVGGILNYAFKKDTFLKENLFFDFPLAWFADDSAVIASSKYGICVTRDILTSMRISDLDISSVVNKEIAHKKISSSLRFYKWASVELPQICAYSNILERKKFAEVMVSVQKHSMFDILNWARALSFFDKVQLVRTLKRNDYCNNGYKNYAWIFYHLFLSNRNS